MFDVCKFLYCWINPQAHKLLLRIYTPIKKCLISKTLNHPYRRNNATIHHPTCALLVFSVRSYPTEHQLTVLELMGLLYCTSCNICTFHGNLPFKFDQFTIPSTILVILRILWLGHNLQLCNRFLSFLHFCILAGGSIRTILVLPNIYFMGVLHLSTYTAICSGRWLIFLRTFFTFSLSFLFFWCILLLLLLWPLRGLNTSILWI